MLGRLKKLWGKEEEPKAAPPPEGGDGATPAEGVELPEVPIFVFERFEEILTFQASQDLPLHTEFEQPLDLADGSTETLKLSPRTREKITATLTRYTADVEASEAAMARLTELYGPEVEARGGREERRSEPRYQHCIRVRSRHLPLFQGLTHEVSASGLRLLVEGEVAAGTALELDMQLDHIRLPDIKARGEIVWVMPREGRSWWAGVKLAEVGGDTWSAYLQELAGATAEGLTKHNFLDS